MKENGLKIIQFLKIKTKNQRFLKIVKFIFRRKISLRYCFHISVCAVKVAHFIGFEKNQGQSVRIQSITPVEINKDVTLQCIHRLVNPAIFFEKDGRVIYVSYSRNNESIESDIQPDRFRGNSLCYTSQ